MTKEIVARIDALNDLMKDLLLFAQAAAAEVRPWSRSRDWWPPLPICSSEIPAFKEIRD